MSIIEFFFTVEYSTKYLYTVLPIETFTSSIEKKELNLHISQVVLKSWLYSEEKKN